MKVSRARRAQCASGDQLALFRTRGGKRRGAGRPAKGPRAGSPHKTRPVHHARYPVHVVLRVSPAVGNLRRRDTYGAIREASLLAARRDNFRILHLSIQQTHLHLIVEADDKGALATGMQGFQISAAKRINALVPQGPGGARRRGTVFVDRYHAVVITSPRQARHTLSYVANNWRKHGEDREGPARGWGRRLILERTDVPGLAGGRGRSVDDGAPADLRAADGAPASHVVDARGLEALGDDLAPRYAVRGVACHDAAAAMARLRRGRDGKAAP